MQTYTDAYNSEFGPSIEIFSQKFYRFIVRMYGVTDPAVSSHPRHHVGLIVAQTFPRKLHLERHWTTFNNEKQIRCPQVVRRRLIRARVNHYYIVALEEADDLIL